MTSHIESAHLELSRRDTERSFDLIEVYGHSMTVPLYVVQAAGWWAMLAQALGVTAFSRGVSGTRAATPTSSGRGGWDRVLNSHVRASHNTQAARRLAVVMYGINDAGWNIPTAMFIAAMRSIIRRTQCCAIMEETHPSIAYTGTWSSVSTVAASGGALTKATATGVTATITVPPTVPPGSTLVLRSTHDYASTSPYAAVNGGTYAVAKNAVAQPDWTINAAGGNPTPDVATYTDIYEIAADPGDVITLTATAVTSEIRFDGYDVIPPSPQRVLVAIPGYGRSNSYTAYTANTAGITQASLEATINSYRAALVTLCQQLGVSTFDLERAVGRDSEVLLDVLHPGPIGQIAIARSAIEALYLTPRREIGTPAPSGSDTVQGTTTKTASVAQVAGQLSGAWWGFGKVRNSVWHINVTAMSGSGAAAVFRVVSCNVQDGTWHTIAQSATISAPGRYVIAVPGGGSEFLGVEMDLSGTSPSITYGIAETHQC